MILATITLIIGWWVIPSTITLGIFYFLFDALYPKSNMIAELLDFFYILVALAVGGTSWAIYLALRLIFGIV